jgi:hypothetical protein
MAVVVEAENDKARQFYLEYGFIEFPGHVKKLFLPMKTVETALAYCSRPSHPTDCEGNQSRHNQR